MVDVKELFEYNREVRHRYFEAMAGLSWEELVADRGASFHSIRSIFVHTLSAIDYWMDLLLGEQVHSHRDYGEYRSIREVKEYMEWVEARVDRYLSGLTPEGLLAEHVVGGVRVRAEDVLVHLFEEEVHHRGELIALLWQLGVEPPPMGWKGL